MVAEIALLLLLFQAESPVDRARQLVRSGQTDEAERLLTLAGSNAGAAQKLRGLIAFRQHNYKKTIKELSTAIQSEKEGSPAYLESASLLGKSFYLTQGYPAASLWLEKVYRAGDHSPEVLQLLGVSSVHASRSDLAREAFAALYGVGVTSAAAHLLTARMMIREESEKAAEIEVRKALEIDPKLPGARFLAGELAMSRGELQKAVDELRQEISYNPTNSFAYYRLGDAYLRQRKVDQAIGELRKSIWLNQFYSSPYILLGRAYYQEKDYSDAEEVLRYAISLDANNRAAYYLLGLTLVRLGRDEEAQKTFLKSRSLPKSRPR